MKIIILTLTLLTIATNAQAACEQYAGNYNQHRNCLINDNRSYRQDQTNYMYQQDYINNY